MKKSKPKKTVRKNKPSAKKPPVQKSKLGSPYGDRILVKPIEESEGQTTSFGIIIPDTAKEKPEQGRVVAVGEGKQNSEGKVIPLRVKVGDRIMFSKYGFDEVKINGADYYLIREDSIVYIF